MVIDVHGHLFKEHESTVPGFQWKLVDLPDGEISIHNIARIVENSQIDKMIISSVTMGKEATDREMRESNRYTAKLIENYPEQFYGYCFINPHYLKESLEEMDYTIKRLGFVGIGEVCPHVLNFEMDSKEMRAIIEKGIELDVPLNLHSSEPSHFRAIAKLAREYPKAKIIMAHLGGFRFWRDGIEAIKDCDNVWVDCSAWVMLTMGAFENAVKELGAERVLFGTDFPICELDMAVYKMRHSGLSEKEYNLISFENAMKIFKI